MRVSSAPVSPQGLSSDWTCGSNLHTPYAPFLCTRCANKMPIEDFLSQKNPDPALLQRIDNPLCQEFALYTLEDLELFISYSLPEFDMVRVRNALPPCALSSPKLHGGSDVAKLILWQFRRKKLLQIYCSGAKRIGRCTLSKRTSFMYDICHRDLHDKSVG